MRNRCPPSRCRTKGQACCEYEYRFSDESDKVVWFDLQQVFIDFTLSKVEWLQNDVGLH
jgi:hypothetical protein